MDNQEKLTFGQFIVKYRIKILLAFFIIIVPIFIVSTIYIGRYNATTKIYFSQELTNETKTIKAKDFTTNLELEPFNLTILWDSITTPNINNLDEYYGGSYSFKIDYTVNEGYTINAVKVAAVLQTKWVLARGFLNETRYNSQSITLNVPFNHVLPMRDLIFFNIKDPILYLKVVYLHPTSLGEAESTPYYIKLDLKNLNPDKPN